MNTKFLIDKSIILPILIKNEFSNSTVELLIINLKVDFMF